MPATTRDQVFISYSHKDKQWLERFQTMLKPMIRKGLTVWEDTQIRAGQRWHEEIQGALTRAKVAVLLVSPDFLASDFIDEHELPPLLNAAEKEGLTIIWIPVRHSLYEETEIEQYQAAHDPNEPLVGLDPAEQDRALVKICKAIKAAMATDDLAHPDTPDTAEVIEAVTSGKLDPLPEETSGARLQFLTGASVKLTRVFARSRLVLGRPKLTADLWLALFPLDDPENHQRMDGISESHAVLWLEDQARLRDDNARAATEINGTPLSGRDWRVLENGDVVNFCRGILQLRVCTKPGEWLRLDRVNNGSEVENYLLLRGSAAIGGSESAALPVSGAASTEALLAELSHQAGGFVISHRSAPMIINGRSVPSGTSAGLKDGDWVEMGMLAFEFCVGAYPGQ